MLGGEEEEEEEDAAWENGSVENRNRRRDGEKSKMTRDGLMTGWE